MASPTASGGFGDALGVDMVEIYVGPSKKYYLVHKTILCTTSDYFYKMFNSGFKETYDQAAKLPDIDPETFELFLEWAYRGSFRPIDMIKSSPTEGPIVDRIKLYGWAERMCMPDLMDYIVTSMMAAFRKYNDGLSYTGSRMIYQATAGKSSSEAPLRKFAILALHFGMIAYMDADHWSTSLIHEDIKDCQELAQDLTKFFRINWGKPRPGNPVLLPVCDFHLHTKDEGCKFKIDEPQPALLIVRSV